MSLLISTKIGVRLLPLPTNQPTNVHSASICEKLCPVIILIRMDDIDGDITRSKYDRYIVACIVQKKRRKRVIRRYSTSNEGQTALMGLLRKPRNVSLMVPLIWK